MVVQKKVEINNKQNNSELTETNQVRSKHLTRNYVWWSMGAGLIPFPFVDILAISGIQLKLLENIAGVYNVKYSENKAKAIVASLIGGTVATAIARGSIGSVLKSIPVVGTFIGSVSMPIFAGATTYAVGKVFIMHFESGGTLLNFDPSTTRDYFYEQFKEGQTVAKQLEKEKPNIDTPNLDYEKKKVGTA